MSAESPNPDQLFKKRSSEEAPPGQESTQAGNNVEQKSEISLEDVAGVIQLIKQIDKVYDQLSPEEPIQSLIRHLDLDIGKLGDPSELLGLLKSLGKNEKSLNEKLKFLEEREQEMRGKLMAGLDRHT